MIKPNRCIFIYKAQASKYLHTHTHTRARAVFPLPHLNVLAILEFDFCSVLFWVALFPFRCRCPAPDLTYCIRIWNKGTKEYVFVDSFYHFMPG